MPTTAEKIIALAKTQVGVREGRVNGRNNNNTRYADEVPGLEWADFQPWCATFVSWLALKTGTAALYPRTASCDVAGSWFKTRGRWSEYPAIGAQVFYGHPRDLNHTGLVIDYDNISIWTVEGNTNNDGGREGDGVYLKKRPRRGTNVIGYGYPAFPEGIKSADPKWQTKPTPIPTPQPTPPVTPPKFKLGRIDFLDFSHWNTVTLPALQQARAAGVLAGFHKATQGKHYVDPTYAYRQPSIRSVMQHGAYHFAEPLVSSGADQARRFLSVAKVQGGDVRPALDLEGDKYRGTMTRAQLTDWVGGFVGEVKRQLGVPPWIYAVWDLDDNFGCPLWVPRYNDAMALPRIPKPWGAFTAWQFSQGEDGVPKRVAGFQDQRIDLNTLNGDPATLLRTFTLGTPTLEEDDMTPAQMDDLLGKVRAVVKEEVAAAVDKRVGDVVKVPANEAGTWKPSNTAITVPAALTHALSGIRDLKDKLEVTTPGK